MVENSFANVIPIPPIAKLISGWNVVPQTSELFFRTTKKPHHYNDEVIWKKKKKVSLVLPFMRITNIIDEHHNK